jgi:hypothetical protein
VDFDDGLSAEHSINLAMERIVGYVRSNPHAADTLEGIASWWLAEIGPSIPPDALTIALERLAIKGVLASRKLPSGKMLWYAL